MRISKVLNFREKIFVSFLVLIATASFVFWIGKIYLNSTKAIPAKGGDYIEGVVGQPHYINPLLSQSSEADADLVQLLYAGLFKYNAKGNIVPDMAESYDVSGDQSVYTIHLKKNLFWHDGQPHTASDIVFTFNILEDQAYKSPLRQNWQGVSFSQIDDSTVSFTLTNPYFGFLNNLTTGILPKHIW